MDELRYRMIMALNAADIGQPMCDQAALICAEIAEQHCAEMHAAGAPLASDPQLLETVARTLEDDQAAPRLTVLTLADD